MSERVPLPADSVLFAHAACGLMLTDPDGTILRVNTTLCRWLGYQADELRGRLRLQDLLPMGGKVFHQTNCVPLLQMQGSVAEVQFDLLHRDGSRLPMLLNIVRRRHSGQLLDELAIFMATDRRSYERELLLARKAAEAALEARLGAEAQLFEINQKLLMADRRKDEFLATLAHELRNPLAPMSNVVAALKLQGQNAPWQDGSIRVLERQLQQLTHLVDDLMEVSRITQGRMALRREPVDLTAIVHLALEDARGMLQNAGHTLSVELPPGEVIVDADATRLTQVIANLLNNAAKYTPRGGHIWLALQCCGHEAVVSVRDTGIGIPKESLAAIFEMFSQLTPALERSQGGLGIGLALVRGLVALHGGSISAASEGVGQGSEFTVRLPLSQALRQAAADTPSAAEVEGLRILVVDDNVDAAESMKMVLELLGHEARTAHNGTSGLKLAEEFVPHVALLDIGLPDVSGYEMARRLRQLSWGKNIVLIAATGWGQESDKQLAREAGFDDHLTKPIGFEQLEALLLQIER
jgi:PAS domain S-box-containing protein